LLTIAIIMLGEMRAVGQNVYDDEPAGCPTPYAVATGDCSAAMGRKAIADGDYSVAIGDYAEVTNGGVSAISIGGIASGQNSLALRGSASASKSVSIGTDAIASGNNAFAIGEMQCSGTSSYGFGEKSISSGTESLAIGHSVFATGNGSYILGKGTSGTPLTNNETNTLMFGMNSNVPTMTITDAGGASGSIGRVGIGTTDPSTLLHVMAKAVSSEGEPLARFSVSDDADGLLQIENGTPNNSKFSPTIVGVSTVSNQPGLYLKGRIYEHDDLGSVAAMIFDVRRVGDDTIAVRSLFQWRGYDGNKMLMDVDGNLGIGTASPTHRLQVNGTARTVQSTFLATSGGYNVGIGTTSPSGKLHVAGSAFVNTMPAGGGDAIAVGWATANGTGYLVNQLVDLNGSSERFKDNVQDLDFDLESFLSMRPVSFDWKPVYGGRPDVGFIAQEVAESFAPLADIRFKHTIADDGTVLRDSLGNPILDSTQTEPYGVKYHKLPVYLFMLAKEQRAELIELRQQVQEMADQLNNCCAAVQPVNRMDGGSQLSENKVEEFVLLQNDPNPFSDYTDIKYHHSGCLNCQIIIIDQSGRVIKRIQTSGSTGTVRVFSSEIGAGLFFYSLVVDGKTVRTEQMMSSVR
jgi:hypothetical protein